jgi:predicted small secreted protein
MKIRLLVVAALALFALTACNTIKGFGQDVKKAGSELEEAAEEARN